MTSRSKELFAKIMSFYNNACNYNKICITY